jgi:hypothetical protein
MIKNLFRCRLLPNPKVLYVRYVVRGGVVLQLFFVFLSPIWYSVSYWLGWEFVSLRVLVDHFEAFVGLAVNRKLSDYFIFGLTCCCVVHLEVPQWYDFFWRPFSVDILVNRAKRSSWIWFSGRTPSHPCSLYEWGVWNPPRARLDRGGR